MLNIEDSVLVVIDIQDRLVLASKYGIDVVNTMVKAVRAASVLGIPTVVTEQYPKGLGHTVPQLQDALDLNAFVTEKAAFSAMLEPAFAQKIEELKAAGKKQIVIGGIETHICVLQTAHDLMKAGFEVYVLKDAILGYLIYGILLIIIIIFVMKTNIIFEHKEKKKFSFFRKKD